MGSRHFENKARQSFWLVHIEAWRRSGLSQTVYCRKHRLARNVFARWLKYLAGEEAARKHVEYQRELRREERRQQREKRGKKPQRQRYGVSTDVRNKAVQAFWAMHVEAMNWSGMGVGEYAAALSLSPRSLRKWHDRFEDGEVEIDWQAHLHPSARPKISTNASSAAKDQATEPLLTTTSSADPSPSQRSNRRSFTDEEKLAIVLESDRPNVSVAEVCRRHGIVTSMVFRWRIQFGFAQKKAAKLATVVQPVEGIGASSPPFVLNDLLQLPDGMMVVDLDGGRRVFAPIGCDPDVVRKYVLEQEAAR
jgi:hypothetical protein